MDFTTLLFLQKPKKKQKNQPKNQHKVSCFTLKNSNIQKSKKNYTTLKSKA